MEDFVGELQKYIVGPFTKRQSGDTWIVEAPVGTYPVAFEQFPANSERQAIILEVALNTLTGQEPRDV